MNPKHDAAMKEVMAAINGDPARDGFRAKIGWRSGQNALPETFCILENVTSDHLSMPETWLSVLCDGAGGVYDLDLFHMSDVRKRLGDGFSLAMNTDRTLPTKPPFNWAGLRAKGYAGPQRVVLPVEPAAASEPLKLSTALTPSPARAAAAGGDSREAELQRRETELLVKESEARILAALNAQRPAQAAAPATSQLESLTPLITTFLKESGENRRAEAQAAREERREQAERDRQARADADRRLEVLLSAMKPVPVPENPIISALLTKAINRDDSTILKSQAEAMAQTTSSMLQILHTQAEISQMNAPQEESPLMKLLTKGIDAMVALNGGTMPIEEQPAAEEQQLGAGEEAPAVTAEEDDGETPLMKLEKGLRKMRPAEEIAELFCACLKDPEFKLLRGQFKGWAPFIDSRMAPWAAKDFAKRSGYLQDVLTKAFPVAVQRGLINPPNAPAPKAAEVKAPAAAANGKKVARPAAKKPAEPPEDAVIVVEEKKAEANPNTGPNNPHPPAPTA